MIYSLADAHLAGSVGRQGRNPYDAASEERREALNRLMNAIETEMHDKQTMDKVREIIRRGNDVEIRCKKDGFVVMEVSKKIRYYGENDPEQSGKP